MSEDDPDQRAGQARVDAMRQTALYAGIAAALLLFFGFTRPYAYAEGSVLYVASVFATNWLLKLGGIALAMVTLCCVVGFRWSLLIDAMVSALIGAALVIIGAIWISEPDTEGFLFLVFGALFLNAARTSWKSHVVPLTAASGPVAETAAPPVAVPDASAKESARERLLQTKANLRQQGSAGAIKPVASPASAESPTSAESAPVTVVAPPTPTAAPAAAAPKEVADIPEDGFLAELGRMDQNERK